MRPTQFHVYSYAYRKAMTDVVVMDLQTNNELTIKCRDLVKKIALYKDKLAVSGSADWYSRSFGAGSTPVAAERV